MIIRQPVTEFLRYFQVTPLEPAGDDIIQVSSATKKLAFAYERFRNTLEPDEEEILRRGAIARILERRLFEDRSSTTVATTLLQEMIRANYIKPCPRAFAIRIGIRLKKAKQVYSGLPSEYSDWYLRLVATAIDHELYPPRQQEALVHLMYHDTYKRVVWSDYFVADDDRPTQLYLACHRALYAADHIELAYHYFVNQFPAWEKEELTREDLDHIVKSFPKFYQHIQQALNHPARDRITRLLRPSAVPYLILRDMIEKQGSSVFESEPILENAAREASTYRLRQTRRRMSRRAWHSILFLFCTKTFLALIIELPYESLLLEKVHYPALAANIAFHPLLLFFLATTVRLPGEKNTERIIEQLRKIVTGEGELPTIIISSPRQYGAATWSAFAIIYTILFLVIFWLLFTFLNRMNFSLLAIFLFVIFLGLVSFLAIRIRSSSDDLRVTPKRETAPSAVLSFLALPVLEFGRWLAQNIRQINVLLFFMDRVLEAPFKLLIDVTEEWFDFVRDRREEIIE